MRRPYGTGRVVLTIAVLNRHLQEAGLEYRARYVPARNDAVDDRIDIVEVEGGVPLSIRLAGKRYSVNRYDFDEDGKITASEDLGLYDTATLTAACVIVVLRREVRTNRSRREQCQGRTCGPTAVGVFAVTCRPHRDRTLYSFGLTRRHAYSSSISCATAARPLGRF